LLAEIKEVKDLRRKAKKEGRESGRQEGRQEGQLIGIRQAIRQALAERYPSLANDPAIEAIDDYARAQRIFSAVLRAKSAREAGAAIRG
jgi:predicted transposase YdaD